METHKTSKAQLKANAKYKAKHKEKQRIYILKSSAKRFIKEFATFGDLDELQGLIDQRRKDLKDK